MTDKDFNIACASCLLHDLKTSIDCVMYHKCNTHNPYSIHFNKQLTQISLALRKLYLDADDYISHV